MASDTTIPVWQDRVARQLRQLQHNGLQRRRRAVSGRCTPVRQLDGKPVLSFASNDYLGLAADERIGAALMQAAEELGAGAGSAQLLGGYSEPHQRLEAALAQWLGRDCAVLFSTGYMANLGLVGALSQRGDVIIQDKLNHASLLDAARLSAASLKRYPHRDCAALQRRLGAATGPAVVLSESLFSMDGDMAPLATMAPLCQASNALLCVDEAHALGVFGAEGAGLGAQALLSPTQVPVIMGTLGKALGTFGAFVAGPRWLGDLLVSQARSHIYTTAPPPALAAATQTALTICRQEQWRRDRLMQRITQFRQGALQRGLPIGDSVSPIQPVLIGAAEAASRVSSALEQAGIWVPAIRPPTVPAGSARLRVSLTSSHSADQVDHLLDLLAKVL